MIEALGSDVSGEGDVTLGSVTGFRAFAVAVRVLDDRAVFADAFAGRTPAVVDLSNSTTELYTTVAFDVEQSRAHALGTLAALANGRTDDNSINEPLGVIPTARERRWF